MLDTILDALSDAIDWLGSALLVILPTSPFQPLLADLAIGYPDALAWLNWFIPINEILALLAAWLVAVGIFYLYSIIMRWIKMIGD